MTAVTSLTAPVRESAAHEGMTPYQRRSKIMSHELVLYVVIAIVVGSIAATVWLSVEAIAERLLR